jgi:hypothetical protein
MYVTTHNLFIFYTKSLHVIYEGRTCLHVSVNVGCGTRAASCEWWITLSATMYFFLLYTIPPVFWTQGHRGTVFLFYSTFDYIVLLRSLLEPDNANFGRPGCLFSLKIILTGSSRHKLTPRVKQEISESNPVASCMTMTKRVKFNLHGQVRWAIYPMQEQVIEYPVEHMFHVLASFLLPGVT